MHIIKSLIYWYGPLLVDLFFGSCPLWLNVTYKLEGWLSIFQMLCRFCFWDDVIFKGLLRVFLFFCVCSIFLSIVQSLPFRMNLIMTNWKKCNILDSTKERKTYSLLITCVPSFRIKIISIVLALVGKITDRSRNPTLEKAKEWINVCNLPKSQIKNWSGTMNYELGPICLKDAQ